MTTRPTASQFEQARKVKVHQQGVTMMGVNGRETVRRGLCALHQKTTRAFVGVNEHGWIFRCPGISVKEAQRNRFKSHGDPHYFTNTPPLEAVQQERQRKAMTSEPARKTCAQQRGKQTSSKEKPGP